MRHRERFTREFKLEAAWPLAQGRQGKSTPTPISLQFLIIVAKGLQP